MESVKIEQMANKIKELANYLHENGYNLATCDNLKSVGQELLDNSKTWGK